MSGRADFSDRHGPDMVWLGSLHGAVDPAAVLAMPPGRLALTATDPITYREAVEDLVDVWVEEGIGHADRPRDDGTPTGPEASPAQWRYTFHHGHVCATAGHPVTPTTPPHESIHSGYDVAPGVGPVGLIFPVEPGLALRAVRAAREPHYPVPSVHTHRHAVWPMWARRAATVRAVSAVLAIDPRQVHVTDNPDPIEQESAERPHLGELITVIDPATGRAWEFVPDPDPAVRVDTSWLLLGPCPRCAADGVPVARIATLEDFGDYLNPYDTDLKLRYWRERRDQACACTTPSRDPDMNPLTDH